MSRPIIAITMGDPAGVGPEIIMKSLAHADLFDRCRPLVIGDVRRLRQAGKIAGVNLAINAVAPTLIRVDSDEVTYNLHILLRYDIERRLFSGALNVNDLPEAWRDASRELLGLEPDLLALTRLQLCLEEGLARLRRERHDH